MNKETQTINSYRRNFLKFALVGGSGFLVGRFFSPLMDFWNGDKTISEKGFENFKMVETNRTLKIFDKDGSEILIVDKDSI